VIPDWLYPGIAVVCIALIAWRDERRMRRRIENFRAIEAERTARENTRPHGNVERVG
jgi:cytochrome c-type biogenesis protein CcmH/NrfF